METIITQSVTSTIFKKQAGILIFKYRSAIPDILMNTTYSFHKNILTNIIVMVKLSVCRNMNSARPTNADKRSQTQRAFLYRQPTHR